MRLGKYTNAIFPSFFLSFNANSKILILFQSFDWLIRINREFKLFPGAGVMLLWVWSLVSWV